MLFHSVTEEDVERRSCLAKSCPNCVRNSLLEDQNHSIVSKMRLLTNTAFVHLTTFLGILCSLNVGLKIYIIGN